MLRRFNRVAKVLSFSSTHSSQILKLSLRTTQTTAEWKTKLASLHSKMDTNDTELLYDDWAESYDDCLEEWGYKVPTITANLLKTHYKDCDKQQIKVFDLGCGTGLVGKEIISSQNIDAMIYGSDLSTGQFPMAKEKGYTDLQQWDLNEFPFPYNNNEFDVLTCAGTLIYSEDKVKLFDEWLRITKPGSIIICSHRTDKMKTDLQYFDEMAKNGKWSRLELTDPMPYLPNNENYGMNILVQFYVAKNEK
eukprot:322188_1